MSTKLGVAIFGLGRIGLIHFKNILVDSRLRLYHVVDVNIEEAQTRVKSVGCCDIKVISSINEEEVFEDEKVDVVFVFTPTWTHFNLISKAIEHGKHIFCEKPISSNENEISELYELARTKHVHLFCSFNRRFDPAISKLRQNVHSDKIGKVLTVKTCSRDHPLPETYYLSTSNGIFHDCAIHDIDLVCWIYDELPVSVYVTASSNLEIIKDMGDVDSALILLKFPKGGLACIDVGRISNYGYDQRVEVHGLNGMLVSENQLQHELIHYGSNGISSGILSHSFNDRYRMSYINALDHFVSTVCGDEVEMSVRGRDAISACIIAGACKDSLNESKPITLSWDKLMK